MHNSQQKYQTSLTPEPGFVPMKYVMAVRDESVALCNYMDVLDDVINSGIQWKYATEALKEYNEKRKKTQSIYKAYQVAQEECSCRERPNDWGMVCPACQARSFLMYNDEGLRYDPPYIKASIDATVTPVINVKLIQE